MKRQPNKTKTKRSLVTLPVELSDEIERYRQDHYINNTSDAIRTLIVTALRHVVVTRQ